MYAVGVPKSAQRLFNMARRPGKNIKRANKLPPAGQPLAGASRLSEWAMKENASLDGAKVSKMLKMPVSAVKQIITMDVEFVKSEVHSLRLPSNIDSMVVVSIPEEDLDALFIANVSPLQLELHGVKYEGHIPDTIVCAFEDETMDVVDQLLQKRDVLFCMRADTRTSTTGHSARLQGMYVGLITRETFVRSLEAL